MHRRSSRRARAAATVSVVLLASALAACSTSTEGEGSVSETDETVSAEDSAMVALCDQMVAEAMSPEDAAVLAESEGYTTRVGSIDGQLQPTTRDYRPDRFTFDVVDGAVVACQYG